MHMLTILYRQLAGNNPVRVIFVQLLLNALPFAASTPWILYRASPEKLGACMQKSGLLQDSATY